MKTETITIKGRDFSFEQDERTGHFRVRRRTADCHIDKTIKITDKREAKAFAKSFVEQRLVEKARLASGNHTVEELFAVYLAMPKKTREETAESNVKRFRRILSVVYGKAADKMLAKQLSSDMWTAYATIRHNGKLDLSTPTRQNIGIYSAMNMARSLFAKSLEWGYEKAGIRLDWNDLRRLPPLPILKVRKQALGDDVVDAIEREWSALKDVQPTLYTAIGLALKCGLRASEIAEAKRHWVVQDGVNVRVVLQDRPEEGFRTKGGNDGDNWLNGLCIDPEFGQHLLSLPEGYLLPEKGRTERFIYVNLSRWVRMFIPRTVDGKSLHRLRGLFADRMKKEFAAELILRKHGIEAAAAALGHKDKRTTTEHYLSHE